VKEQSWEGKLHIFGIVPSLAFDSNADISKESPLPGDISHIMALVKEGKFRRDRVNSLFLGKSLPISFTLEISASNFRAVKKVFHFRASTLFKLISTKFKKCVMGITRKFKLL
jgi:hypothetical protein